MLDYKFEILEVVPEIDQMMVKFTSEGREDVITGTPLPTEGVSLNDFLRQYAPIGYWLDKERKTYVPEVGATGEHNVEEELAKQRELEIAMQVQNVEPTLSEEQIKALIEQLKK